MSVRQRMLPPGWYPTTKDECVQEIEGFIAGVKPLPAGTKVYGGMMPHAGWYFSGRLAARVFYLNAQATQPQVVCIFGGHLGGDSPPLLADADSWETPLGQVPLATEFYQPLRAKIPMQPGPPGDNTIEVNMAFAKYFFPKSQVLGIRSPQSDTALKLGAAVAEVARDLGKTILFFGSTDLTHYGPNYGFAPKGYGADAVKWVKEVNDKHFLDAILKLDAKAALADALHSQCACSPGGAVSAMVGAQKMGATKTQLVGYYTSYDVMPADSFVGYGGVIWES